MGAFRSHVQCEANPYARLKSEEADGNLFHFRYLSLDALLLPEALGQPCSLEGASRYVASKTSNTDHVSQHELASTRATQCSCEYARMPCKHPSVLTLWPMLLHLLPVCDYSVRLGFAHACHEPRQWTFAVDV